VAPVAYLETAEDLIAVALLCAELYRAIDRLAP